MIRVAGPSFDDLDPAIDELDELLNRSVQTVMAEVAGQVGRVRIRVLTSATEPAEPSSVSLDSLAVIATLWTLQVDDILMPQVVEVYLRGARVLIGSISAESGRRIPEFTDDQLLTTAVAGEVLAAARNRMVNFGNELWETARTQLLEGFLEGESIDELKDRLTGIERVTRSRARTVARTEIISASNSGSLETVRLAGFTGIKEWQATMDDRTRPTHGDGLFDKDTGALIFGGADGTRVPLGGKFKVGLSELSFPGDPLGSPEEIINCRCTLLFDLDESLTAAGEAMDTPEWIGVIAMEGKPTGDGRMFAPGALTWADLPAPLLWQHSMSDGHDNSVIVGNITQIGRKDGMIIGRGTFNTADEDGARAYRMVKDGYLQGISVDADNFSASDVEYQYGPGIGEGGEAALDMTVIHAARIRAATLLAIPAFVEARISLMNQDVTPELVTEPSELAQLISTGVNSDGATSEPDDVVTASAYTLVIPDVPPASWFDEPNAGDVHGALTVTDHGRVYGYLAPAGVAHRSYAQRVTVPMNNVDYSLYMGRETIVEGGERVVTGALTMDCGHASTASTNSGVALDHYDNACSVVATVRIGENANGVWIAGALIPGISAYQLARMMACQLSGDWRPHRERKGWREFAGALLVPVPGFAMSRTAPSVRLDQGELVASAVPVEYEPTPYLCPKTIKDLADIPLFDGEECGCFNTESDDTEPASLLRQVELNKAVEVLAESVGLDLSSRIAAMRDTVNARRQ